MDISVVVDRTRIIRSTSSCRPIKILDMNYFRFPDYTIHRSILQVSNCCNAMHRRAPDMICAVSALDPPVCSDCNSRNLPKRGWATYQSQAGT